MPPIVDLSMRREWSRSGERALHVAFALMIVATTVASVSSIRATIQDCTAVGVFAIMAAVATMVTLALWILLRGATRPWMPVVACAVLLCGQVFSAAAVVDRTLLPANWWGTQLTIALGVLICGVLDRRPALIAMAVVLGTFGYLRLSGSTGPDTVGGRSDLAVVAELAATAMLAFPIWRRTVRAADESLRSALRTHAQAETERAAEREHRVAVRLLHDEVIHALRAIALPPGAVPPAVARSHARSAADLLEARQPAAFPEGGDLESRIRVGAQRYELDVRIHGSTRTVVPTAVNEAIVGAVLESLRNVQAHAGVNNADVTFRTTGDRLEVQVRDEGRGFDPSRAHEGRLGIRGSIRQRLDDVGGRVEIDSSPGRGTIVGISWRPTEPPVMSTTSALTLFEIEETRADLLLAAGAPLLVGAVLFAVLNAHASLAPWLTVPASLATVLGTVWALIATHRVEMPAAMCFGLIVAVTVTLILGGWFLAPQPAITTEYFAAGAASPALALVAFLRPPWESVTAATTSTIIVGVACYRAASAFSGVVQSIPVLLSCALPVATVLALRWTMDRLGRDVDRDAATARLMAEQAAQIGARRTVMAERLARVRNWVAPFLMSVADGAADPGEPSVSRRAAVLEAAVRDDIQLGSALDDQTRDLITSTRMGGGVVEINAEPDSPTPSGSTLTDVLNAALAGSQPPGRTVVTIARKGPDAVSLSVLVCPDSASAALQREAHRHDGTVIFGPGFVLVKIVTPPERVAATGSVSPDVGTGPVDLASVGVTG